VRRRRRGHVRLLARQEFHQTVASHRGPIIVVFGFPGCPGCRRQLYWLQRIFRGYSGRVAVHMVDADREGVLAREFRIGTLPTHLLLYRGREIARWVGYRSRGALNNQVLPVVSLLADRSTVPDGAPVTEDDVRAIRRLLESYRGDLSSLLAKTSVEDVS
jgi:thioredoxin 1